MQERWEAQWQDFLKTLQPAHAEGGKPMTSEAAPWDDTKAFLASFEQVAKAFRWPRGEWAARLLPALSGEAEDAFRSLEARDQEDYGKGPLTEEFEEPSDPVKGQIYKEAEQNGSLIKSQHFANSSLLPEEQKMNQTGVKEEEKDVRGSRLCLQIVSRSLPRPAQQTTVWQVLQEDGGNVEPSGDMKGSKVKMEDCQYGGIKPRDMSGKASPMGQAIVLETAEMHKEGCKSQKGQEPVEIEVECHEVTEVLTADVSPPSKGRTRDNIPMFSKYEERARTTANPGSHRLPRRFRSEEKAMKEEKSSGPELEEEPVRAGKVTSAVQSEYLTEQAGWDTLQDGKRKPSKGVQDHWEAQWQEFLRTLQPIHTGGGKPGMSEMSPWDDTKAFLASFEQVAKACRWPRGEWAARLLPALSGEAEQAFRSLEARDQEDYGKVKAVILRGEALRMEAQRQHFRQFCCQEVRDPRRIHSQVQELCRQWLKPERHSKEQILELLILEQFLASLPADLQGWIRAGGPDTCSQALALAEDFLTSQQEAETGQRQPCLSVLRGIILPVSKEEQQDFLDTEEGPLDAVKGQIYKEAKRNSDAEINVLGSGIKFTSHTNSSLSAEELETIQSGVKEGEVKHNKSRLSLQILSPSLNQPAQETVVWQVLQEEVDNVDFLGDEKGSQVKMENSQCAGNEPEDTPRTAPQRSEVNVLETAEMQEEGCQSKDGQEKQPVGREKECNELTEQLTAAISPPSEVCTSDNMPTFSKYGRRYRYTSELVTMMHTREDHTECQVSEETAQRNVCFDQTVLTGESTSELSENGKGGNLRRYQSNHTGEKPDHPAEFGKSFSYMKSLKRNQGIQSEERPYECSQCKKCFSQREHLLNHQQLHTGEKRHECPQCGILFTFRNALVRHQKIHTAGKPEKGSQPGKCFNQGGFLKINQGIHTEQKSYSCSQCGKCFRDRENLKRHLRIHTGEKPYKCSQCGKSFRRSEHLKNHQSVHTGEKPYKCSQCGKCFSYRNYLKIHQRIHTGEKPYKCPECGRSFTRNETLKTHQRIHTGEKPYECSQCGKYFRNRVYLKNHQRIHTGEKSYECSQCGKYFRDRVYLKNHQTIHNGEKPHKCPECGKASETENH
ncbi:zinc finger protein with KRAB and SCAN domains 7-like [Elgaria multicarinata webbii]|uniref:zinc finger protein with KRAB and SCAN domains 7-like n=1 Tax=Elgaria multicarinata webbii TaxID=159646 RepID=UPI002FCD2EA0